MRELIEKIFNAMEQPLSYFYGRWMDERQYEDFSEYATALKTALTNVDSSVVFVTANKRPFGLIFKIGNTKISLAITSTRYSWSVVR